MAATVLNSKARHRNEHLRGARIRGMREASRRQSTCRVEVVRTPKLGSTATMRHPGSRRGHSRVDGSTAGTQPADRIRSAIGSPESQALRVN